MSKENSGLDLAAMMAGLEPAATDPEKLAEMIARELAIPAPRLNVSRLDPWTAADHRARRRNLDADRELHAHTLDRLVRQGDALELLQYVGGAIAHMLDHGVKGLRANPAWRSRWEPGMPDADSGQFYLPVALAVPGQLAEAHGSVFFHFDDAANLVGAGLQLPPRPHVFTDKLHEQLGAKPARALFNIVVARQKQKNGLDMWAIVREDIDSTLQEQPEPAPDGPEA